MRFLLLLLPVLAFGQGTDLPGNVGALPDSTGAPTAICSWNTLQTKCAGIVADGGLTGNDRITVTDTAWEFDHDILTTNIYPSGISPIGSLGFMTHEWLSAHIQNIYNYGPNPFSIYSNTGLIAVETAANQPIQFYTNGANLRGAFLGNGHFNVANLAGTGTRCLDASSTGDLGVGSTSDCIDPAANITFTGIDTFTQQITFSWSSSASIVLGLGARPNTDLTGNLGDFVHHFGQLFVPNIYDYSSTPFSIYADTQQISFDTNANQPIQFYTNATLRGQFTGAGAFNVAALSGTGFRDICANASGDIVVSGSCPSSGGVTSVTGTSPIVSSGGTTPAISCPTCGTVNSSFYNQSCSTLTLSGSYQTVCSNITVGTTGTWLVTGAQELIVASPTVAGLFYLNINGTPQTGLPVATLAQSSAQTSETVAATVSQSWIVSLNSGDTVNLSAIQSGSGTSEINGGSVSAVFLHL